MSGIKNCIFHLCQFFSRFIHLFIVFNCTRTCDYACMFSTKFNSVNFNNGIFIFAFGGYELPLILGATVPKALPVQSYLSYMDPNLLNRPYAMAMNGVILMLSMAIATLYGLLTYRLGKKIGGAA